MTRLERLLIEIGLTEGMLELVLEGYATIEFKTTLNGRIRTVEDGDKTEYRLAEEQPDPNPINEPRMFSDYEKQHNLSGLDIEDKHNLAVETVEPIDKVMLNAKVVENEEKKSTTASPLTNATPTDPFEQAESKENVESFPKPVFTEYKHPSEHPKTKIVPQLMEDKNAKEKAEWTVADEATVVDGTISVPEKTDTSEKTEEEQVNTVPWGTINSNWMKF